VSPRLSQAQCIYREENVDSRLEIWDEGNHRSLWFDDVILQSEICLDNPAKLPNPVNRAMLAPLMFDLPVQRVLLAGCGGGAIARWFNARAPAVAGDAVELSPTVARLAREYFDFPAPAGRWRLLVDDIRKYLASTSRRYDYMLVDLEEKQITPDWVVSVPFLTECANHLTPNGILVLNLISHSIDDATDALFAIRQVFDAGITLLGNPDHDNLLVLATPQAILPSPMAETLQRQEKRWGIEFTALARRLKQIPPVAI